MEWIPPLLVLVVLLVVLGHTGVRRVAGDQQSRRLAVIDRKLNLIMDQLGIREPGPDAPAGVLEQLMAGRKLQAIKVYREATSASLAEAKDAVELLARRHGLG
jgi:hypothetical protein